MTLHCRSVHLRGSDSDPGRIVGSGYIGMKMDSSTTTLGRIIDYLFISVAHFAEIVSPSVMYIMPRRIISINANYKVLSRVP